MPKKEKTRDDLSPKKRSKGTKIAKTQNRKAAEGVYEGIPYDSGCELACLYWLTHLRKTGYVLKIERSPSFLLSDAVVHNYSVQMKRSSKPVQQTIMNGHSYTADFMVTWHEKALGRFIWVLHSVDKYDRKLLIAHPLKAEQYVTYLEVKPDFSFQGKTEKSVNDMKWVFQKFGLWINLFKPNNRFEATFCPSEYMFTSRGVKRTLHYTTRNLETYIRLLNRA